MTSEEQTNRGEQWWSYTTRYDVIKRAEILANEGEHSQRVIDIDSFASFVNNEMHDDFIVVTQMDEDADTGEDDPNYRGSIVYRPNESGEYEPHASIIARGRFIGNKIMFIDGRTVVVNTYENIGISASEYIVLESVCSRSTASYIESSAKVSNFTQGLLRRLILLDKGQRRIYR